MTLRPSLLILLPIALGALLLPRAADAGFQVNVMTSAVTAGSSNDTLQVTLTNTGPVAVSIDGFAFQLTAGGGLTFTSVDFATTPAYIFAGQSGFGPDLSNGITASTLNAEDNATAGGISLGAGRTLGLGDVHFNVSSGITGPIAITVTPSPITNFAYNGVDITNSNGTNSFGTGSVTVNSAVPEPSTLAMTGLAVATLLGYRRARGRRD